MRNLQVGEGPAQRRIQAAEAVAKKDSLSGRLILFPAMIETYAILSLVVSLLLLP